MVVGVVMCYTIVDVFTALWFGWLIGAFWDDIRGLFSRVDVPVRRPYDWEVDG